MGWDGAGYWVTKWLSLSCGPTLRAATVAARRALALLALATATALAEAVGGMPLMSSVLMP